MRSSRHSSLVLVADQVGLFHGRAIGLLAWRDVVDHPRGILVDAPDMSAVKTAVVPEVRVRTGPHQRDGPASSARRTILNHRHPPDRSLLCKSGRGIRESQRRIREFSDTPRSWRLASREAA